MPPFAADNERMASLHHEGHERAAWRAVRLELGRICRKLRKVRASLYACELGRDGTTPRGMLLLTCHAKRAARRTS
jgi:hypothetical protein